MGMYDYVDCKYPLPDGWQTRGPFQTKDFGCELATYRISEDGVIEGSNTDYYRTFTGMVRIYDDNLSATGHGYCLTSDNEKPWWREYTLKFVDGKVAEVTGGLEEGFMSDVKHLTDRKEWERLTTEARERHNTEKYNTDHSRAIELSALADEEPDPDKKSRLFYEAAYLESGLARRTHTEPSCSVLTRSAMSLYLNAGSVYNALQELSSWVQMQRCCSSPPPMEVVDEICELIVDIKLKIATNAIEGKRPNE